MKQRFPQLYEFLFRECEKKGYNQTQIAKALKMSDGNVSRIRKGEVGILFSRFLEICEICHLSPSDMFKKWEHSNEYIDIDRRKEHYERIIKDALEMNLGLEIDSILESFRIRLDIERNKRRKAFSIKRIKGMMRP